MKVNEEPDHESLGKSAKRWTLAEYIDWLRYSQKQTEADNALLRKTIESQKTANAAGRAERHKLRKTARRLAEQAQAAGITLEDETDRAVDAETNSVNLAEWLGWAIHTLQDGVPEPSHKGGCGPEAGCDGGCLDFARFCGELAEAKKALKEWETEN